MFNSSTSRRRYIYITLLAVFLFPISSYAINPAIKIGDLYYLLNTSSGSATVVSVPEDTSQEGEYTFSQIDIPSKVTIDGVDYDVTGIGIRAFYNCQSIESVTIPSSVTNIRESAFQKCSNLKSVDIPSSVKYIYRYAFSECSSLTSVTIPNSVTSIYDEAFEGCSALTSVTIPNSVTSIGVAAFEGCSALTSVTIPSSVTKIPGLAFRGCSALTSVTIPNSVTSIGSSAFRGCSSLTSIDIPNSVTFIDEFAFFCCSALTSVAIPNSVTSIGNYAFSECSSLTSVTIPNSVTYISNHVFEDCSSLTSVDIPNSVTSIYTYAFRGCSSLTSIDIPNSVTSISAVAFEGCSSLTSITIPSSVTSIGSSAFSGCTGLTSIICEGTTPLSLDSYAIPSEIRGACTLYVPKGCVEAYKSAKWTGFKDYMMPVSLNDTVTDKGVKYECTSENPWTMAVVGFTNEVPANLVIRETYGECIINSIDAKAFYHCSNLTSVTIPNSVTSIGRSAFEGCSSLTSVTIPNSVTSIGYSTFSGCTGLTSVTIPNSVTSIDYSTFSGCTGLTSVTIPNSVTSIEGSAFSGCSSLTSVTIPNSVTSIGSYVFSNCTGLTSVIIPRSVTEFGISDFESCTGLIWAIFDSTHAPGTSCFSGCTNLKKCAYIFCSSSSPFHSGELIRYPSNTVIDEDGVIYAADKTQIYFVPPTLSGEFVIPNSVNTINEYAFSYCTELTSVTIPNSVTSIDSYAFYGCTGLTSVTIPNSVTSIGRSAFENCSSLTSMTIPNSVTSIGSSVFYGCTGLTSATIPNSVTSIGDAAFSNCSSLTSVDIPNSVTSIGECAFYGCSSLTWVTIPNSVTSIEYYAFYGCTGLTSVTIPNSVTSIGSSVFYGCTGLKKSAYPSGMGYSFSNGVAIAYPKDGVIDEHGVIYNADKTALYFVPITLSGDFVIPKTVTTINGNAFYGCAELTSLTCLAANPPAVVSSAFASFDKSACTLTVPAGSKEAYMSVDQWKDFLISEMFAPVEEIRLNADHFNINTGDSYLLTAEVLPLVATDKTLTWASSDATVCTVDAQGMIKAISNGIATITATTTDGTDISATCTITVTTLAQEIRLSTESLDLKTGETYQLTAEVLPLTASNKSLTWTSSDAAVCTVDENGLVKAAGNGTATITAAATDGSDITASCTVTVTTLAQEIRLSTESLDLKTGETHQLTAEVLPLTTSNKTLTWTSSDAAVCTIDPQGMIKAISNGIATITATTTDGTDITASCTVTVTTLAQEIRLNAATLDLKTGETYQLTAEVLPLTASNKSLTWTSSDAAVCTVDENGLVKAAGNGTATITATATDGSGITASCTVTVTTLAQEIRLSTESLDLKTGETYQLTAEVLPLAASNKSLTWTSSDVAVCTVDVQGVITGVGNGTATITATTTDGTDISASCTVTVTTLAQEIRLNAATLDLKTGETYQLTAEVLPLTTSNKTLTWTSSDATVCTVDAQGMITGVSNGIATITATTTDGTDITASCTITVTTSVQEIRLSAESLDLKTGETYQLTAELLPLTASDITISWTSSNTAVCTVDAEGLVKAAGNGTATITAAATDGSGITASCTVTITDALAESITINYSGPCDLKVGETAQLSATVLPENAINKSVNWISQNEEVITVSDQGLVTAISIGQAEVCACTSNGLVATISFTVTAVALEDGLQGISADSDVEIYDLKGCRVTHPTRGRVYIINGQKVLY